MPIRLVCPSCSATLSVKDEYAGRAVKCPKCAGVIPASQPGATPPAPPAAAAPPPPPPPPPEPEPELAAPSPFGALDDMAAPKPKATGRPTGKPVAKARAAAPDDEDEKPARRKNRDDDDRDDERGARGRGDDEDQPNRGKKTRDDDDEDDRPAKKKGGGGVMIVAIICGTLLLCCGGTGVGVYYYVIKPIRKGAQEFAEKVEKAADEIKTWNFLVDLSHYNKLDVGDTTRTQADKELGAGRIATDADLTKVFAAEPGRADAWKDKVAQKRAVVWQNSDDYIIAAFNPTADGTSRLQAKEWRPKSGATLMEGELNDAKFLVAYPVGGGPGTPVTAEVLAQAYVDGTAAADTKYKKKMLLVEGTVDDIDSVFNPSGPREWRAKLKGVKKVGGGEMEVHVMMSAADGTKLLAASRGQTVKLKGKCKGYDNFSAVELTHGTFESSSPDPNPTVTATELINDFAKNSEAADEKYTGKAITITNAIVERKEGDTLYLTGTTKKGGLTRIKAEFNQFDDSLKKQLTDARVGSTVKIKGDFRNFSGNNISIGRAYIAP